MCRKKKKIPYDLTCGILNNNKKQTQIQRGDGRLPEAGHGRVGGWDKEVAKHKLPVMKYVSHGNIKCSRVTGVKNSASHI